MTQQIPKQLSPNDLHSWLLNESLQPVLVDVREPSELLIAPFPSSVVHLPLSESSVWINKLSEKLSTQGPIVVICHSGIRSWNFAIWLIEQDWNYEVWNLEGGIDAWSLKVDPSVPRY